MKQRMNQDRMNQDNHYELQNDASLVDGMLSWLQSRLEDSCLEPMPAFQLQCAVVELINNCIQHAYGDTDDSDGQPIKVRCKLETEFVEIVISDRGRPFDGQTSGPASGPHDESGRGLEIVRAFVAEVQFSRDGHWNRCRLKQCKNSS